MSSGNVKFAAKNGDKVELNVNCPKNKKIKSENSPLKNLDLVHFQKMNSVQPISKEHSISPQHWCPRCRALSGKVEELNMLKGQIKILREKNQDFKEEIQLMSSNFSYILELAAQNIMKGVKSRVKNLLVEKQNIIQKQSQIIKRLQSQSLSLINKIDGEMESQQRIQILQEKLKQLQAENESLRKKSQKKSACFNFQLGESIQLNSTDICSGGQSPKDLPSGNFQFRSLDFGNDNQGFGLKKRRTLEIEGNSISSSHHLQDSQKINLESLKNKINKMKQQIVNQKF